MEDRIGPLSGHLPFLRRFAHALAGSPELGDALAVQALRDALEQDGTPDRAALFARLLTLHDAAGQPAPRPPARPAETVLWRLDETDRRLYLLVNLEGLPVAQAARVVGVPHGDASDRLRRARDVVRVCLAAPA